MMSVTYSEITHANTHKEREIECGKMLTFSEFDSKAK